MADVDDVDDVDEDTVPAIVQDITPTPAMLAAALTGDPQAMSAAVAFDGCQPASTCPAQYGACTNWSAPSNCGDQCGPLNCICKPWLDPDCFPGEPRYRLLYNAFRVCFDTVGNSCTEYTKTSVPAGCGC